MIASSAPQPSPVRRGNPCPLAEPITHRSFDGTREAYSICRCTSCGFTARCTPLIDFFTLGPLPDFDKPLLCMRCFYGAISGIVS